MPDHPTRPTSPPADVPAGPAWDLTVLDRPTIIGTSGRDEKTTLAAAALDAQARGDPGAAALTRELAHTGVVAIRDGRRTYVCRETVTGWVLLPTRQRASARTFAAAAVERARRLAALRQRAGLPPPAASADGRPPPARVVADADPDPERAERPRASPPCPSTRPAIREGRVARGRR
jgi:hypothetical protein